MRLRWLWAGVPLAVLVAVLTHVVAFGTGHAAGGTYAFALLGLLAAALALRFGAGFLSAAVARRSAFATEHELGKSALALASVASLIFAGLEIAEGHDTLAAGVLPALALLPIALGVLVLARQLDRVASRAGSLAATYLRRARIHLVATFARRTRSRVAALAIQARRIARGRAPPRFA